MRSKELKESDKAHYFTPTELPMTDTGDDGTRDMFPLAPFVVSGGRNTERYYFVHVNDLSEKYKFNIRPKYFGDESAYTEVFPQRIKDILSKNMDAKIFCVFDMDTVYKYNLQDKHKLFVASLKSEIDSDQVILCDSMPSFEFWLLLHFVDYKGLLKNYSAVSQKLAPHIKPYFEDSTKGLKKLLKSEKYLQDSTWVRKLLEEGRIEQAVMRAKDCLARVLKDETQYSYSNVFRIFE